MGLFKNWGTTKPSPAKVAAQPIMSDKLKSEFSNSVLGGQQLGNLILQIPKDQSNSSYQQSYITVSGITDAGRIVDIPLVSRNATCMSNIFFKARTLAQLPLRVMYYDDNDRLISATSKNSEGIGEDMQKRARAIQKLLQNPNGYQSCYDWLYQLSMHLDMFGESFTVLWRPNQPDINQLPTALYNLEPSLMTTRVNGSGMPTYQISTGVAESFGWPDKSILQYFQCMHVMESPFHGQDGFNKSVQAAELVSLDHNLDLYCNYAMENGAKITGVITHEKLLPQNRLEEIKNRISNFFAKFGLGNAGALGKPGQVAILDQGLQYQKIDMMTVADAEAQALKEMTTKRICSLFGVPPALLGMTDGKFNNLQTLIDEYYKTTLCPLITNLEAKLTQQLCRNYPRLCIQVDVDPLLKGAPLDQAKLMQGLSGIMSVNEQRKYMGMPASSDPEHDKVGFAPSKEIKGESPQDTGADERSTEETNKPKLRQVK